MKKKTLKKVDIMTPTGKVAVNLKKYPHVAKMLTTEEYPPASAAKVHIQLAPGPLDKGSFDFSAQSPEEFFRKMNFDGAARKSNPQPKTRKLQSKRMVPEQTEELEMAIKSKCPAKWLFVDLETGDVWHHREGRKNGDFNFWREATTREIKEMKKLKTHTTIKETKEMLGK